MDSKFLSFVPSLLQTQHFLSQFWGKNSELPPNLKQTPKTKSQDLCPKDPCYNWGKK